MSLDVWLKMPGKTSEAGTGIYIRENGSNREITRAEWDERFPGREPIALNREDTETVYSANITHNLGKMASEAGLYYVLWRPEEIGFKWAFELIDTLRWGLTALERDPERFKQFNPANGWGDYAGLVEFVRDYLAACEKYPDAEIYVWR